MLLLLFLPISAQASNATEARALFNNAWRMFTSPNGCSLSYSVILVSAKTLNSVTKIKAEFLAWNPAFLCYFCICKKTK